MGTDGAGCTAIDERGPCGAPVEPREDVRRYIALEQIGELVEVLGERA